MLNMTTCDAHMGELKEDTSIGYPSSMSTMKLIAL